MARTYNVSFNITGTESGLLAALKSAQQALRGLGQSARAASAAAKASQAGLQGLGNSLKNIQTAAAQFKTLQDALKQTAADFSKATSSIGAARAKMEADALAAKELRDRLSDLNKELNKAKTTKLAEQGGLRTLRQQLQELKRAFALAKSMGDTAQMASLNRQMATLGATIQAQQAKVKAAAQAYKELSDKIKQTRTDLKAAEQAATSSGQGLTRARADAERLKQAFTDQLAALGRLRSSLSASGFNVSSFAASESRLQSEINRVNAALERQQNLLNAQNRSAAASQEMFNAYNNFQGALQTAQQIASPFTAAIDTAMDFEHAMSRVKALTQSQNIREGRTDVVQREMEMLTQQARDLGATTMFTSTQAAQAMGYLGMAGWKAQQIYGTMPGMLDLAAAAGADLAQTADIVSDNMTAMGVPVNRAAHFMDVYAYALTNSNARLSDFGETMKYAAPVAKAYGSTLDETAAMVMMMANAGIKGSMAGTSLRMGLLRLAGPPKTATKEMAKLGLSLSDAQAGAEEAAAVIKGLGIDLAGAASPGEKMTRVLMQLHEKTKDLSQDEKLAVFKGIFGVNAETGWLALFDQGPEVFLRYVEGLRNADGYARQVAQTMNDDTRGAIILLESAWDALKERIGGALLPAVKTAAEAFAPMVSAAAQWIETHPGVVQACAAIAGALAGLVVAAAAVKLAFAGWRFIASSIGLVQAALASLGSGALLGGLIGRLAALRAALFGVGGAATFAGWSTMFTSISARATAAAVAVRGFFASLTLGGIASSVVSGLTAIGTAIRGAAMAAMSFAFSPVGAALVALALAGMYCYQNWDRVAPVLSNIASIITGALAGALQTIQPAIQNLMAAFDSLANSGAIQALVDSLGMLVTGALATIATTIAGVLATVINVGVTILSTIANVISGIVNLISNVLSGNWSAAWENMKAIAISVVEGMASAIKGILDGILTTVNAIGDAWNFLRGKTPHGDFSHGGGGGDFGQPQPAQPPVPQAAPAPETPQLDTSATQAALDAVGTSASTAATNMEGVNTAAQSVTQAGAAFANLPAAVEPTAAAFSNLPAALQPAQDSAAQTATALTATGTSAQNLSTAMQGDTTSTQAHTAGVGANTAALQANIGALQAFGAACQGAVGGVTALGSAASSAAGAVSGLGSAAQSACAELAAAGANAASAVNSAVASMPRGGTAETNYEGGIYKRGAFLTTFAERSPEAAIPLDNSRRAKDLWTQAGEMLGILPQTQPIDFDRFPTTTPPFNPEPEKTLPQGERVPTRARRRPPQRQRRRPQVPRVPQIPEWAMQPPPRQTGFTPGGQILNEVIRGMGGGKIVDAVESIFGGFGGAPRPTPAMGQRPQFTPGGQILNEVIRGFGGGKIVDVIEGIFGGFGGAPRPTPAMGQRPQFTPGGQILNEVIRGFGGGKIVDAVERIFGGFGGDMPNRILTPQMPAPSMDQGGLIGRLVDRFTGAPQSELQPPMINLTVHVTINGNADEATVQRGVEAALPAVDDWARRLSEHRHEQRRRSYA